MALDTVLLSGDWQFRPGDQADWQGIAVPGCWETLGLPRFWEGPGWYRKTVEMPTEWRRKEDQRLWVRFGAVSYACQVWVNGVEVGAHVGAAGGDRPSYIDHWTHESGETLQPRIGLSHYGATIRILPGYWELIDAEGKRLAKCPLSDLADNFNSGSVGQLAVAEFELPTEACPFWREAMKLFEPHPLWAEFPHTGFTDINFFGLGPDCALLPDALQSLLPDAELWPLLRRVDARTFAVTDYLTAAVFPSNGCLMLSTLRLHGGLGDQPDGMLRHTAGRHLFASILHTL